MIAYPVPQGVFEIPEPEMLFVQYMPIKFPGVEAKYPDNLRCFEPIIRHVLNTPDVTAAHYVYITAKRRWVDEGCRAGRPGWHIDGFGTKDINYIWSDSNPTQFIEQTFDLSDDHEESIRQMELQAVESNIYVFPNKTLVRLDPKVIHRVTEKVVPGYRTFVKLSISEQVYNLKGNAHNYLYDYNWDMVDRKMERNHPIGENE